jgi:hypothetical protein
VIKSTLCAILALISLVTNVYALDMNLALDQNEKLVYLNLWGKIEPGDDQKFREIVLPLLKNGYLVYKINLFTGGGSIAAAKGMADQIRILQTRTVAPTRFSDIVNNRRVERNYPSCWFDKQMGTGVVPNPIERQDWCNCASACFIVWASGMVREGNHVGVHRIYYLDDQGNRAPRFGNMPGPAAREEYLKDQKAVQLYLESLDVPKTISDIMWATDSDNMHYLTRAELQLMQSTPYLEEQTRARCGPDRTVHMSPANNWTSTQDVNHMYCYRGILREFMRAGAESYLRENGVAHASLPTQPEPLKENTSRQANKWLYNGSSFELVMSKDARKFIYTDVRDGLREAGVTVGMILFDGVQKGKAIQGTAYVFSARCGAIGYAAKGMVSSDQRRILVSGRAPYVDAKCAQVSGRDAVLEFEKVE